MYHEHGHTPVSGVMPYACTRPTPNLERFPAHVRFTAVTGHWSRGGLGLVEVVFGAVEHNGSTTDGESMLLDGSVPLIPTLATLAVRWETAPRLQSSEIDKCDAPHLDIPSRSEQSEADLSDGARCVP